MIQNRSYSFYSDGLNKIKYDLLYLKAKELLEYKNKISEEVNSNLLYFIGLSKFEWINHFRTQLSACNNQDISNAIVDVFTVYSNKIDAFNKKIKFFIGENKVIYYKRDGRSFKKGEIRGYYVERKSTELSKILSYITKFYNDGFVEWLKENKDAENPKLSKLRNQAYEYILKYGNRILNLVKDRQARLIKQITEHKIEFTSLSFRSCNELRGDLLNRNKNGHSIYGCYITIGAQKTDNGKIHIPVKYNEKHHGKISDYSKSTNKKGVKTISYTVCFDEKKKKVRIILSKEIEYTDVIGKENYYGIDINVKHNLFCDKYGNTINYEMKIVDDFIKFLKQIDKKKENKKKFHLDKLNNTHKKLSKKDTYKYNKWNIRIKDMLKRKCNKLIKQAITKGKNHIVMEDIGNIGKSFSRMENFSDFKISRLVKLLNLADVKNMVSSIAHKFDLQVTFVQPHYSSQTCRCGHISKENRTTQEMFSCVECNHTEPADIHAAGMLEDRMKFLDLRNLLLNSNNGLFTPKILNKETIKNILYDFYSNSADKTVSCQIS